MLIFRTQKKGAAPCLLIFKTEKLADNGILPPSNYNVITKIGRLLVAFNIILVMVIGVGGVIKSFNFDGGYHLFFKKIIKRDTQDF